MMRISREEETFIGRARPSLMGRMKVGFSKEGRSSAWTCLLFPTTGRTTPMAMFLRRAASFRCSISREAMRWRGATMLTNTPPRSAQSSPGGMQGIAIMEPVIAKAARKLGLDQVAIRRINCPEGKAPVGPVCAATASGLMRRAHSSRKRSTGARNNSNGTSESRVLRNEAGRKVRGVGVSLSCYVGGTIGFDGLLVITPEGRVRFQSGIGNLGTESVIDVHRAGAEILGVPWEKCDITWGDTSKNLPFTCVSGGSQTTHAMTRAAHAVGNGGEETASGNRSQESRWQAGKLRSRQRARLPQGRWREHDVGAGCGESDSTRRHLRRPRAVR